MFASMRPSILLPVLALAMPMLSGADMAYAQMAEPSQATCTAPAPLPETLAGWASPAAVKAAGTDKGLAKAALTAGKAATVTLLPTPRVAYALRPEKPGGSVSYGGLLRFTVAQAGSWRVALSSGAWVDVVKDGTASVSTAHGHGPDCTGVRKMVDHSLTPGVYTLQIAANGAETMTVMVTPLS